MLPLNCSTSMPGVPLAKVMHSPTRKPITRRSAPVSRSKKPRTSNRPLKPCANMLAPKPMDRLVCGDVGFGKTEVAMRAAFIAVHGGRQVAILVPTTLLAQQHYNSFRDRFADWPVTVEVMSRFKSAKEVNAAIADLAEGKIDIVIGTHKLLSDDVKIKTSGW